jgi:hypothetical protein
VTPANAGDGEVAMKLLEQQAKVGLEPAEVVADHHYAGGELRAQAQAHGEGTTIVTKAAAVPDRGSFDDHGRPLLNVCGRARNLNSSGHEK